MATLLQHSTFPQNEPWYLRAMASKSREEVGHTKEGQQHANRLESIAKMLEAAVEIERERDELRLRFSDGMPKWIACAEQLPKRRYVEEPGFPGISINCLVVDADGDFDVAAYDLEDANWYSLQRATFLSGITHWMPLPEAPK